MHIERYYPGLELFRFITLFILQIQPIVEGYLQYHNSSSKVYCVGYVKTTRALEYK